MRHPKLNLEEPNTSKARTFRIVGYTSFALGVGVLVGGLLVSLYFGSLVGVLVTLLLSGLLLLTAFVAGGLGWSRLSEQSEWRRGAEEAEARPETPAIIIPDEEIRPYMAPRPSDQDRPAP